MPGFPALKIEITESTVMQDVLKIDATFVRDQPHDADDVSIIVVSISLGHKLGLAPMALS